LRNVERETVSFALFAGRRLEKEYLKRSLYFKKLFEHTVDNFIKVVRHIEMSKAAPKSLYVIFKNLSNINSLSKNDKLILVQTFVYILLSNLFIFGQTIDVSLIKL